MSTPLSLGSRSSSLLSTTDEQELEPSEQPQPQQLKLEMDAVFDLVLDLRQQDLQQYKTKLRGESREEVVVEAEPEKVLEETKYRRFKHPVGVAEAELSNLGDQSDLARIILPTRTLKIEETSEPARLTSDLSPLIVKTTPARLGGDTSGSVNLPVTLHIEEDRGEEGGVGQEKKNDDPEIKTNCLEKSSDRNKIFANRTSQCQNSPRSAAPTATTIKYQSPIRPSASTPVFAGLEKSGEKVSFNDQFRF